MANVFQHKQMSHLTVTRQQKETSHHKHLHNGQHTGNTSYAPPISSHRTSTVCLASPANFIYGQEEAKVLSHVTSMPVLIRQIIF